MSETIHPMGFLPSKNNLYLITTNTQRAVNQTMQKFHFHSTYGKVGELVSPPAKMLCFVQFCRVFIPPGPEGTVAYSLQ